MYWISADFSGWFRVNPTKCLKPFLQNMWLSNFNLGKGGGRLTTNSPLPPPYVRPWLDNGRQNECFKWIWYFALNKFLNSETKGRSITCDFLSSLFLPGVAIIMASSNLKKKNSLRHCMCTHIGYVHYPTTCVAESRAGARIHTTIKCLN